MDDFFVYILRRADGSYYVGHTEDLASRIAQHQGGELRGYTCSRRPVVLTRSARFATRDDAFVIERKLKGWSRAKKEALIRGDWSALHDLPQRRTPDRHRDS